MPADFVRKDGPAEYGLALPVASQVEHGKWVQVLPSNYFAARGGGLVHLVSLVDLVCLVRRTRETRQPRPRLQQYVTRLVQEPAEHVL